MKKQFSNFATKALDDLVKDIWSLPLQSAVLIANHNPRDPDTSKLVGLLNHLKNFQYRESIVDRPIGE